jgi:hypothetical protein
MRAKAVALSALLLALLAATAGPAGATPPTTTETVVNSTFHLPAGAACSFPLTIHNSGLRRVTTFFDDAGNVTRTTILLPRFTQSYTNETTGKMLSTPLAGPAIIEPNGDGTVTTRVPGNDGRLVVPGQGFIYGDLGLIVYTALASSPFTPLDVLMLTGHYEAPSRYLEELCASLT